MQAETLPEIIINQIISEIEDEEDEPALNKFVYDPSVRRLKAVGIFTFKKCFLKL